MGGEGGEEGEGEGPNSEEASSLNDTHTHAQQVMDRQTNKWTENTSLRITKE